MNITIIKDDQLVQEGGESVSGIDLSDLPDNFHALHWDGKVGEIEWKTVTTPNQQVSSESEIDSALGVPLSTIIERKKAGVEKSKEFVDLDSYEFKRLMEYGPPDKQIEFITENGLDAWKERVSEIKKKFPKP
tara:strand:- start:1255 stop:1653 length:399 start_codon:yes stop_codon:yes gene_type:complete